jgi:hypothetical protein
MTSEIVDWEKLAAREKADLLRGPQSYKEHYNYLMDWYMRDRKLPSRIRGIPTAMNAEVHESLKDVLEALKELNAKVSYETSREARKARNIFARLCA